MNVPDIGRRALRRGRAIRSRFASRYFVEFGGANPDVIFIAGTGRSGTTWLAEILARGSRRRLVFEPFRNDRVPEWHDAASRQYIRAGDADSAFLKPAQRIFDRRFRNEWADYYNERFLTRGRIVKDIRANLMLRWLYDQLGPFPIVYLLRHPGAVAVSWKREGWDVSPAAEFLSQKPLLEDFLAPFSEEVAAADDPFDRLIHSWAIENEVALRQLAGTRSLVVLYENLILQPELELARIARLCRFDPSRALRFLDAPSATSSREVGYASHTERLSSWQRHLRDAELGRIEDIIGRYGLSGIYRSDGTPDSTADSVLRRLSAQAAIA